MSMEAGAEAQQSGETAISESEAQQITLAQVTPAAGTDVGIATVSLLPPCGLFAALHSSVSLVVAGVHSSEPGVLQ